MKLPRRPVTLLAAALLAGCGAGVPHATVAAVSPSAVPAPPPAPRTHEITAESVIEVVGADTITGDHVVRARRFEGTLTIDEPASCAFILDMQSLSAESTILEDFIKSPNFLDARRYPQARFVSTAIQRSGSKGGFAIEGRLALHGVEKAISFPATLTKEGELARIRADFLLPRRAFALEKKDAWWDKLLEDDFRVHLDIVARPTKR